MTKSKQEIIDEIDAYIANNGGHYAHWYVGVTKDARGRLFNDHKVDAKKDLWIYRPAKVSDDARAVEKRFLSKGCDGGVGSGDDGSDKVYAYRKTAATYP